MCLRIYWGNWISWAGRRTETLTVLCSGAENFQFVKYDFAKVESVTFAPHDCRYFYRAAVNEFQVVKGDGAALFE